MLDKGTDRRSKIEIAETLENLGAEVHFVSEDLRLGFYGRALRRDVGAVIGLVAEQLRIPALMEEEFEVVRVRSVAAARRTMESTADQAERALRRALFDAAHPNYGITPEDTVAFYESADLGVVQEFHREHFGARDLNIVFVGDVDPDELRDDVATAFAGWSDHSETDRYSDTSARAPDAQHSYVEVPDKPNSDVAMGHAIGVRRDHPDFIPLYVGNYILGGNFSARLMQKIRDELGLTYGIRSSLADVSVDYNGFWQIAVTLSGESLAVGIEQTLSEVRRFVEEGVTSDELSSKQTTIAGSYAVGLATTTGLARAVLTNVERGFGPGYLDRFPEEVRQVSLEQVNSSIARHLDPELLHVATAGSNRPIGPASETSG
jgi:predicted Zn-dependent peptidase